MLEAYIVCTRHLQEPYTVSPNMVTWVYMVINELAFHIKKRTLTFKGFEAVLQKGLRLRPGCSSMFMKCMYLFIVMVMEMLGHAGY